MKNFKRATNGMLVSTLLLFLYGCDPNHGNIGDGNENYRCNGEQIDLVKREVEICKQASYLGTYCFNQAKKSQCVKIGVSEGAVEL